MITACSHRESALSFMKRHGAPYLGTHNPHDDPPDVRDGLTSRERIVLQCLDALQQDRGGRHTPVGMLYGSVVEYVSMSIEEAMLTYRPKVVGWCMAGKPL
jgi:hypothetical protein